MPQQSEVMKHLTWGMTAMRVSVALALIVLLTMCTLPASAGTPTIEVTVRRGDIRSGPGATHELMGEVRQGEKYAALEKRGEWYRIRLVDGREGWLHEKLVSAAGSGEAGQPRAAAAAPSIGIGNFYGSSWAVVVGINDYRTWPPLNYAVNDARSVRSRLLDLGFEPGKIFELYNRDATKENILRIVADELPRKTGAHDRVLFFFAGHGQTEELPGGIKRGFLIPVDGDLDNLYAKSIPMNVVADISQRIPAKHILFLMDACYSGLAFARSSPPSSQTPGYLEKITGARARQIITAGGAGEQVIEQEGHGLFTRHLIEALDRRGDRNGDGVLTAFELGNYLRSKVSTESANRQTPVFGTLDGEGEFVFLVPQRKDGTTAGEPRVEAPGVRPRLGEELSPRRPEGEAVATGSRPASIQYHLLVTHLDFGTFASYLEKPPAGASGEEVMPRLEGRLDRLEFPSAAVIPGRDIQLLSDAGYGSSSPSRMAVVPMSAGKSWTTLVWEGQPGARVAFVMKSDMQAWPEVRAVAANPEGVLRRLSIGGPSLFGGGSRQVPEASYDLLVNMVNRGSFTGWVAQHARALNGMSIVVGRGRGGVLSADRVYAMITLPPEPRTFKLVIGWEQPDRLRDRFPPRR
jgi:Caspase domain/Bacterial SH3 domain